MSFLKTGFMNDGYMASELVRIPSPIIHARLLHVARRKTTES